MKSVGLTGDKNDNKRTNKQKGTTGNIASPVTINVLLQHTIKCLIPLTALAIGKKGNR